MTKLKIFFDDQPQSPIFESDKLTDIVNKLQNVGIRFEQWETIDNLEFGTPQETVLKAYQKDVDKLIQEEGYLTVDVVSLSSDNPDKVTLRQKFLNEHTHSDDEVRFFVAGKGLFSLHIDNQVGVVVAIFFFFLSSFCCFIFLFFFSSLIYILLFYFLSFNNCFFFFPFVLF